MYPSHYCDIAQSKLKQHSKEPHNFKTVKCCTRTFERMEKHLKDQIEDLDEIEDFNDVDEFCEFVFNNDRNDIERIFRD